MPNATNFAGCAVADSMGEDGRRLASFARAGGALRAEFLGLSRSASSAVSKQRRSGQESLVEGLSRVPARASERRLSCVRRSYAACNTSLQYPLTAKALDSSTDTDS
jgi:hypothetical protein